ncbi:iron-siderophore ABC transporter substrate-binding protein [Chlorogloeopsis sp. ULAP01]|uniref:iron-siderophore ABC transporter substrate-binding protein n=1 Tax=Chlorogloeopsis sp. ULAP01 TaxID=3056483 RepID=UPI0025ABFE87|nr:iron-siderophore ABC transporter substrate-binding protein [Chlorogloeopsis sp. ULAP01]
MKKFLKKIYAQFMWLTLSILMVIAIAACSNTFVDKSENLALIKLASCRVIQHSVGKTCIPHHPKRLATLSQFTLANAIVLGVKPIGSASALNYEQDDFPAYLKDRAEGIELLGEQSNPNLEKIVRLKPDLILGWEPLRKIYPLLSQISPTALDKWRGPQFWREHFNFVAEALGKEEAAKKAWSHYYQRIEQLKIALGNRYKDKTISIISVNDGRGIVVDTKNSFAGSVIDDIGLQRSKSQNIITPRGRFSISEEKLGEIDGDILFISIFDSRGRKIFEKLQEKPLWQTLKAVQQKNVYLVEQLTWGGANLLAADAVIDDLFKYLINTP